MNPEMIRADVAAAVREPTFTIRRNASAAARWFHRDAHGRVIATGLMSRTPRDPVATVTLTRRSDPVIVTPWGQP